MIEVILGGRTWQIHFVTRKEMPRMTWGDCDKNKQVIRVRSDLSPQNFLDTLIHELRHAQHPVMFEAEEFVDSTSTELAIAILATGRIKVDAKNKKRR